MSNSVASESNEGHETPKTSSKRGGEDEGEKDGDEIIEGAAEVLTTSTTVSATPAATDQFMHTPEFKRHFVEFVPVDAPMALRLETKAWKAAADAFIDRGVESGAIIVHDGKVISNEEAGAREERRKLATRVNSLLNITKVGGHACCDAINLVVVVIPEGVKSIGYCAFYHCRSLTTVSFPTTLTSIGKWAFVFCESLDNVDLLQTNLQELGRGAFAGCSELTSITIAGSLQTLGGWVFNSYSKLVPSYIDVRPYGDDDEELPDPTSEVVEYLRAKNLPTNKFIRSKYFLEGVESGELMVHGGDDISTKDADALKERREHATRMIFLLTKVEIVPACTPTISSLLISPRALRASVSVLSIYAIV